MISQLYNILYYIVPYHPLRGESPELMHSNKIFFVCIEFVDGMNAFPTNMPAIGTRNIDYKKKARAKRITREYIDFPQSLPTIFLFRISKADET